MPRALFMFLKLLLSRVCRVAGCTVLTGEAPLILERAVAMEVGAGV